MGNQVVLLVFTVFTSQLFAGNLINANQIFNSIEDQYPEYFSPVANTFEVDFQGNRYYSRKYTNTGLYLGLLDTELYLYDDSTGKLLFLGYITLNTNKILTIGEHGDFKDCRGFQMALNFAQEQNEIRIERGTYKCNDLKIPVGKDFTHGIRISGGWNNSFETRNNNPEVTVIDGGNIGSILSIQSGPVILSGLTFQNGFLADDVYGISLHTSLT